MKYLLNGISHQEKIGNSSSYGENITHLYLRNKSIITYSGAISWKQLFQVLSQLSLNFKDYVDIFNK